LLSKALESFYFLIFTFELAGNNNGNKNKLPIFHL